MTYLIPAWLVLKRIKIMNEWMVSIKIMILELTLRKIVPLSLFLFCLEKKKAKHFFFKNVSYQGVKDSTTLNLGRLRDVKHFFPKNSYSGYPFLKLFFFFPHVFYIPGILKQQWQLIKGYY